jgi:hypothetical protein
MAAQTAATCAARKNGCVSRRLAQSLGCWIKATRQGVPVDPTCLDGVDAKFAGGAGVRTACYPGVDAKGGCAPTDDAATMATSIDDFVNGVVTDLDSGATTLPLDKCAASKQGCVSKLVGALLRCYATAERKSLPVSSACLAKAHASFDGGAKPERACFARIEAKSACASVVDDTAGTEADADAVVASVACALGPTELCLQPTPAATPGGPTPTGPVGTSHATPSATRTGVVRTPRPTRTPTAPATRTATPGSVRTATPGGGTGGPTPVQTPPPPICGDGIIEPGEDCDGTNLDGYTCDDFCIGSTGTLACTSDCFFTTAACGGAGCEDP